MIKIKGLIRKSRTAALWHLPVIMCCFMGCSVKLSKKYDQTSPSLQANEVTLSIDASESYQTMDNFGASDAWSVQYVGNWPLERRNAIADLLFSTDTASNGQPEGIGLSLWRFNIGAGSAQQGEQSGIRDEWRRAESFLGEDGSYDWQQQAGQVWFLKAAKERGVNKFLAFPNSPPVHLTKNGKAFASDAKPNLAPERFSAYADFLADVIQGVERTHGISFGYISPVNEPQWDWSDGGQEGTPFMNEDIAGIVRAIHTSLESRSLSTKIDIAEAGKINYLYEAADKPGRGNQIEAFFNSSSPHNLGNLSRVGKVVSAHSYFTTSPFGQAVTERKKLAAKVATVPGLEFWMSEYCILGDNAGEIDGNKRDLGIDPAIYLARVIHNDLTVANATAWHWWLAVSPYDYKDGLVYVDKNKTDGGYYESKMLWALGNYSRFIRPGALRVSAQLAGPKAGNDTLLASSYLDNEKKQLITVAVNAGTKPVRLKLDMKEATIASIRPYVTTADKNLEPGTLLSSGSDIMLAPRSVTTLVARLQ